MRAALAPESACSASQASSKTLLGRASARTARQATFARLVLQPSCRAHLAATRAAPTSARQAAAMSVQEARRAPPAQRLIRPAPPAHTQMRMASRLARTVSQAPSRVRAVRPLAMTAHQAHTVNQVLVLTSYALRAPFEALQAPKLRAIAHRARLAQPVPLAPRTTHPVSQGASAPAATPRARAAMPATSKMHQVRQLARRVLLEATAQLALPTISSAAQALLPQMKAARPAQTVLRASIRRQVARRVATCVHSEAFA